MQMFICTNNFISPSKEYERKSFWCLKTQGLYCHELIYRKWVFAKTQILGWELGRKVKLKVRDAQPEIFQGRTDFLEQKHFDKHFMHDIQKKGSAGENFLLFFLQGILKTAFQVRI